MNKLQFRMKLVVILVCCSQTIWAAEKILLSSFVQPPPKDALTYLSYLLQNMDQPPLHGEQLGKLIEKNVSRDAGVKEQLKSLEAEVDQGKRLFINGSFDKAIVVLERANQVLLSEVALMAGSQLYKNLRRTALMFTAHAYLRKKQPERASAAIREVILSYPNQDLSLIEYSPEIVHLYKTVRLDLIYKDRGTLTITTDPQGCIAFVNERYVGISPTVVKDLIPGHYRVFSQCKEKKGRVQIVSVTEREQHIAIEFGLDQALRTNPFVGFLFADSMAQKKHEVPYATTLAKALGASQAIVVGIGNFQGKTTLAAKVVDSKGQKIRSGMIVLQPKSPTPAVLRSFGQFILNGRQAPSVIVEKNTANKTAAKSTAASADHMDKNEADSSRLSIWKWSTLGLAIAGIASGVTLLMLDGQGKCDKKFSYYNCKELYSTTVPGITFTALGGLSAVASGVLFYLDARSESKHSSVVSAWVAKDTFGAAVSVTY